MHYINKKAKKVQNNFPKNCTFTKQIQYATVSNTNMKIFLIPDCPDKFNKLVAQNITKKKIYCIYICNVYISI